MLPFLTLPEPRFDNATADTIDQVVAPWITQHTKERLPRVVNCVGRNTFGCILVWAVFENELGVLQRLESLPVLVQQPRLFSEAVVIAAANGHLALADWIHQQMLTHKISLVVYVSDVETAISRGHLTGVKWVLKVCSPELHETFQSRINKYGLMFAIKHRQAEIVGWFSAYLTPEDLVEAYFNYDDDGSMLCDVVDPHANVDEVLVVSSVSRWVMPKVQQVFDKFVCLHQSGLFRTHALAGCLFHAVLSGNVPTMAWLIENMDRQQVHDVLFKKSSDFLGYPLQHGIYRSGASMLDMLEAHGIYFTPEEIDQELYQALRQEQDKTAVPAWLSGSTQPNTRISALEWLVERRGGRVAVMGRMIMRLASGGKRQFERFKTLYNEWLLLVHDDLDERRSIKIKCLATGRAFLKQHMFSHNPQLFVDLVTTESLTVVASAYAKTERVVALEVLRAIEIESLSKAINCGRQDIIQFLERKMKRE
ncbi:Aste57867_24147 [Aphanomyces stellatus]|uniref:Aste57867_24147 protein n=1 Tax=Aphanomyces stellatus TaxID=120398 RepID=A0A485KF91_9STRA|nr:hypothetical protein As57867_024073 [Aphanomyces stellatus]KAF0715280.1 hypothetical protein As57867_003438 [Aphanomyces stellatus]KAF0715302.1 hypothetical protein As57867_003460 [Aphanomyces stellatus]VFT80614.1 Aste57867_3448 [Aphanomyces stellatus]VFT80636.1 Aste57867_3470 [Aphanomyces stellatus]